MFSLCSPLPLCVFSGHYPGIALDEDGGAGGDGADQSLAPRRTLAPGQLFFRCCKFMVWKGVIVIKVTRNARWVFTTRVDTQYLIYN